MWISVAIIFFHGGWGKCRNMGSLLIFQENGSYVSSFFYLFYPGGHQDKVQLSAPELVRTRNHDNCYL